MSIQEIAHGYVYVAGMVATTLPFVYGFVYVIGQAWARGRADGLVKKIENRSK